jgi:hypothetical protein
MSTYPSIGNAVAPVLGLVPQAPSAAAAVNGTGIDVSQYEGVILLLVQCATPTSTDTLTWTVEESTDNSTFTALPADALINVATGAAATFTVVTSAATAAHKFQVLGIKKERCAQYLRVVATKANTNAVLPYSAAFIAPKKYA